MRLTVVKLVALGHKRSGYVSVPPVQVGLVFPACRVPSMGIQIGAFGHDVYATPPMLEPGVALLPDLPLQGGALYGWVCGVYPWSMARYGRPLAHLSMVEPVAGVLEIAVTRSLVYRLLSPPRALALSPRTRVLIRPWFTWALRLVTVNARPLCRKVNPRESVAVRKMTKKMGRYNRFPRTLFLKNTIPVTVPRRAVPTVKMDVQHLQKIPTPPVLDATPGDTRMKREKLPLVNQAHPSPAQIQHLMLLLPVQRSERVCNVHSVVKGRHHV